MMISMSDAAEECSRLSDVAVARILARNYGRAENQMLWLVCEARKKRPAVYADLLETVARKRNPELPKEVKVAPLHGHGWERSSPGRNSIGRHVVEMLQRAGRMRVTEIARRCRCSEATLRVAIYRMRRAGVPIVTEHYDGANWHALEVQE